MNIDSGILVYVEILLIHLNGRLNLASLINEPMKKKTSNE